MCVCVVLGCFARGLGLVFIIAEGGKGERGGMDMKYRSTRVPAVHFIHLIIPCVTGHVGQSVIGHHNASLTSDSSSGAAISRNQWN